MQTMSGHFAVWSCRTNSLFSVDKIPMLFSTEGKALKFLAKLKSVEWRVVWIEIVGEDYEEIERFKEQQRRGL